MLKGFLKGTGRARWSGPGAVLLRAWLPVGMMLCAMTATPRVSAAAASGGAVATHVSQPAYAAYKAYVRSVSASASHREASIPAFARKYNLPCSACHTAWPELTAFGQRFKDNGYQMGNDRDSPIWRDPSYWPLAIRTTPHFNIENTTHQPIDPAPSEQTITQSGFDLSGVDFLMLGTLYKNVTFGLVTVIESDGASGIEAAFARFDNLGNSPWANLKLGKFELDNLLSTKRFTWLSNNGGFLYAYDYLPAGSAANFSMAENQIGAEFSGHSLNSYTRYSVSLLSPDNGETGLGTGKGMDAAFTLSQAFPMGGGLGPTRIGVFGYLGRRPLGVETINGEPISGTFKDFKPFYRLGATAQVWLGNLELLPLVTHNQDDAALGAGGEKATWNTALLEAPYIANTRLMVQGRYEMVRMSKQGDPAIPKSFGNADAIALGVRAYPFMFSRDGMAIHGEFGLTNTTGMAPLSGDGSGEDAYDPATKIRSLSFMLGFDFAF
jgi:hypothetical protein